MLSSQRLIIQSSPHYLLRLLITCFVSFPSYIANIPPLNRSSSNASPSVLATLTSSSAAPSAAHKPSAAAASPTLAARHICLSHNSPAENHYLHPTSR